MISTTQNFYSQEQYNYKMIYNLVLHWQNLYQYTIQSSIDYKFY
jgi:hypothetical protein